MTWPELISAHPYLSAFVICVSVMSIMDGFTKIAVSVTTAVAAAAQKEPRFKE